MESDSIEMLRFKAENGIVVYNDSNQGERVIKYGINFETIL